MCGTIYGPVLIIASMILDERLSFTVFAAIQKGKGSRMLLGALLFCIRMIELRRLTLLATCDSITIDCHGSFGVYPISYAVEKSIKVFWQSKHARDAFTCLYCQGCSHKFSVRPFRATDGSFFCKIASVAIASAAIHHEVTVEQEGLSALMWIDRYV